jgi:hypothetical protein
MLNVKRVECKGKQLFNCGACDTINAEEVAKRDETGSFLIRKSTLFQTSRQVLQSISKCFERFKATKRKEENWVDVIVACDRCRLEQSSARTRTESNVNNCGKANSSVVKSINKVRRQKPEVKTVENDGDHDNRTTGNEPSNMPIKSAWTREKERERERERERKKEGRGGFTSVLLLL